MNTKTQRDQATSGRLTANSKLMHQHATGQPVDKHRDLGALRDESGRLSLLSIGTDGHLFMQQRSSESRTGWAQHDLSAGSAECLHFGTAQTAAQQWVIATVHANNGQPSTVGRIGAGSELRLDNLGSPPDGSSPSVIAPGFTNGAEHIVVACEPAGGGALKLWHIHFDGSAPKWVLMGSGIDLTKVRSLQVGSAGNRGPGVYVHFGDAQGNDGVLFVTFQKDAGGKYEQNLAVHIPVGYQPASMSAVVDLSGSADGASILYAATDTVYRYSPEQQLKDKWSGDWSKNTGTALGGLPLAGVAKVVARNTPEGGQRLWALTASKDLYFANVSSDGVPGNLVALMRQVEAFSVADVEVDGAHELAVVGVDGGLNHMYQDPTTSVWRRDRVVVQSTDNVVEFDGYNTQLSIVDERELPAAGVEIELRASQWTEVVVNGRGATLGPDRGFKVSTNANGSVSVVQPIRELATPALEVRAAVLSAPLIVRPGAASRLKMDALGVDELLEATSPLTGEKLVRGEFRDKGKIKDGLKVLKHYLSVTDTLPTEFDRADGAREAVPCSALEGSSALHFRLLGDGGIAVVEPDVAALAELGGVFDDFGDTMERLLEGFIEGAEAAFTVVADGVVFAIKGAVKVLIDCAEKAWGAINWLMDKAFGFDFNDLAALLGFFFDWDDVLATHKVMKNFVLQTSAFLKAETEAIGRIVDKGFGLARDKLKALAPPDDPALAEKASVFNPLAFVESVGKGVGNEVQALMQAVQDDPTVSWIQNQLFDNGLTDFLDRLNPLDTDALQKSMEGFTGVFEGIVESEWKAVNESWKNAFVTFGTAVEDAKLGMSPDAIIRELTERVGLDVLDNTLNFTQPIFDGVVDLAGLLMTAPVSALDSHIDIPLLTWLYENVITDGNKASILDVLLLAGAVSSTVAYKAAAGKAPFGSGDPWLTATYQQIYGPLLVEAGAAQATIAQAGPELDWTVINAVRSFVKLALDSLRYVLKFVDPSDEVDVAIVGALDLLLRWSSYFLGTPTIWRDPDGWAWAGFALWVSGLLDNLLATAGVVASFFDAGITKKILGMVPLLWFEPKLLLMLVLDIHKIVAPSGDPIIGRVSASMGLIKDMLSMFSALPSVVSSLLALYPETGPEDPLYDVLKVIQKIAKVLALAMTGAARGIAIVQWPLQFVHLDEEAPA